MNIIRIALMTVLCVFSGATDNGTLPNNTPTSDLCLPIFDAYGNVHTGRSLYNCASVMQDPYMAISSIAQYSHENLTVYCDLVLNNLIELNELANYVVIDFYFRQRWQDIRWVSCVSRVCAVLVFSLMTSSVGLFFTDLA